MNEIGLEAYSRALATALVVSVVAGAMLALATWVCLRVARPNAATRHFLWWIVVAASAVIPVAIFASSLSRIERVSATAFVAGSVPAKQIRRPSSARVERTRNVLGARVARIATSPSGPRTVEPIRFPPHAALALAGLWLAVATARAIGLAASIASLRAITTTAIPLEEAVLRRLRRWRYCSRAGRRVRMLVSDRIAIPAAAGFFAPSILFPPSVVAGEPADLDHVALHEYAHLERYDDWSNLCGRAVACVLWFNPFVMLALRATALEREVACDDWVVARTGRPRRYAACLWHVLESAGSERKEILAPGALTAAQIVGRIERLLGDRGDVTARVAPAGAFVTGALALAGLIIGVERAPAIAIADATPPLVTASMPHDRKALPGPHVAVTRAHERRTPTRLARESLAGKVFHSRAQAITGVERLPRRAIDRHAVAKTAPRRVAVSTSALSVPALPSDERVDRALARAGAAADVGRVVDDALSAASSDFESTNPAVAAAAGRPTVAPVRSLPPFHRIEVETDATVIVRRAASPNIRVGDARAARDETSYVESGTLYVTARNSSDIPSARPIIVESPDVDDVVLQSSGTLMFEGDGVRALALTLRGSGSLVARGNANAAVVTEQGSGSIDVRGLQAASVNVLEQGSGDVAVGAPRTLDMRIEGSGTIRIYGRPVHETLSVDGSGSVEHL